MTLNLSTDLRRALHDAIQKAKKQYDAGEDDAAARTFELASQLSLKLAESAPDRTAELKHKKDALRFRELAKRIESGEAPPPQDRAKEKDKEKEPAGGEKKDKEGLAGAVSELITTASVTWEQIGGLEETKREIKYALALSIAKPPKAVKITSFRNMLFYGPPGTGKTLLAAATSNALRHHAKSDKRAVFFNVKVSSLLSKYFGESSKLVSELYGQARDSSPAVVFLDEFEALAQSRDKESSGAERRILSTLLSELDGLAEKGRDDVYVLTVAATNRPWDLDAAVLSRFDKKILIPLPDEDSRRAILRILFEKRGFETQVDMEEVVALTEGFSGRELERLAKEVQSRMVAEENADLPALVDKGLDAVRSYQVRVRPLVRKDFEVAVARITPQTKPEDMAMYLRWQDSMSV